MIKPKLAFQMHPSVTVLKINIFN